VTGAAQLATSLTLSNSGTIIIGALPSFGSSVSTTNYGTIDFGTNDYFTCPGCTVTNESGAKIILDNADNSINTFNIDSGSFDNKGLIVQTGYQPGTQINCGLGATIVNNDYGQAEQDGLTKPSWVSNLNSQPVVQALSGARGAVLTPLAAYDWSQTSSTRGIGNCANVNASIIGIQGSWGVCMVVDSSGQEAVNVSVSGSGVQQLSTGKGGTANEGGGVEVDLDAGFQVLWNIDSSGHFAPFNVNGDAGPTANFCEGCAYAEGLGRHSSELLGSNGTMACRRCATRTLWTGRGPSCATAAAICCHRPALPVVCKGEGVICVDDLTTERVAAFLAGIADRDRGPGLKALRSDPSVREEDVAPLQEIVTVAYNRFRGTPGRSAAR
jgi:hypothetical protein